MAFEQDNNPLDINNGDFRLQHLQVYGREGMQRISDSKVLVIGMQGLGAEIAKQLILVGMKDVVLQDEGLVEEWDISGNFLFTKEDIGRNRALASVEKLQKLNKDVVVSGLTTKVITNQLSAFQAVVYTDIGLDKAYELNDFCHTHNPPIAFIKAEVRGLFGGVFCDFGPEFTFPYEYTEREKPTVVNFLPMKRFLVDACDDLKSDRKLLLLHFAFQALDQFVTQMGRFPKAGSEYDANRVISFVANLDQHRYPAKRAKTITVEDRRMLQQFAFGARAVLSPMATLFGGIVGQEVIKACSKQFFPIDQLCYLNLIESLPTKPLKPRDFKPLNSLYEAQISVFGQNLQTKLEDANVLIVGSGPLACELLKNMELMGVSSSEKGNLTINYGDDGVTETNNIGSHFLFRDEDTGVLQNRVGLGTEDRLDDFWTKLDVVVNALDSFDYKAYIDKRCLKFMKPFLESATHGTKCSTLVVIPNMTENFVTLSDLPNKSTKLLPCIATSTAVATGLVCLELYKVIDGGHQLAQYQNSDMDLAVPFFNRAVPYAANSTQQASKDQCHFLHTLNQIFVESGFVVLDFRARKVLPWTSYYAVPRGGRQKVVKLTVTCTNNRLAVAAESLFSRPTGCLYKIELNEKDVLNHLRILWAEEEQGFFERCARVNAATGSKIFNFWKLVKDKIVTPVLIDIGCRDSEHQTLIGVLRICQDVFFDRLLNGVDICMLSGVCKLTREMTKCDELWEKKCYQDFKMGWSKQAYAIWKGRWKERYGSWKIHYDHNINQF